jgi:hypothetical protein
VDHAKLGELTISEVTTSRVGPMSAYDRIFVIDGDIPRLPPVATSRHRR